jgi:hypothetical protein
MNGNAAKNATMRPVFVPRMAIFALGVYATHQAEDSGD